MIANSKNVQNYVFGRGAIDQLPALLADRREADGWVAFLVDEFFRDLGLAERFGNTNRDIVLYLDVGSEPTTDYMDEITRDVSQSATKPPAAIVGVGGGASLDIAKAVSNPIGNGGRAEDYQSWDLVGRAGVYKIGVPTLSGTGVRRRVPA
jgi:3-deoxy-alpha-D-manno-octulosonate 8-oxidase